MILLVVQFNDFNTRFWYFNIQLFLYETNLKSQAASNFACIILFCFLHHKIKINDLIVQFIPKKRQTKKWCTSLKRSLPNIPLLSKLVLLE